MAKAYSQIFQKISQSLFLNADFKGSLEFEKKYIGISLQRAKLFKWVTLVVCLYSFYLDFVLSKDQTIDLIYRQNLLKLHIIGLILSLVFIVVYEWIEKSERYRISSVAKGILLLDMFLTMLIGATLSINSQRFSGNIDAYIMIILVVALVIPLYPKWVLALYSINHIFFLTGLSYSCKDNNVITKQGNSTTTLFVALVLFFILYRYNIKNFLNEERLKEDKLTFIKLFEINPFPLLISRFEDGKIRYANRKAMLFYEIPEAQADILTQDQLYKNASDLNVIRQMLEMNGKVYDYVVEQKTLAGQVKSAIVNYEVIDYFGEKAILSGATDITEIKRMEKELTIHASIDVLTGVLNRRVGMDLLQKKLETSIQQKDELNLCFFDIDKLKTVNDKLGHLAGDALIIDICKIIRKEIKPEDIIFRYGGDEFIIVFDHDSEEAIKETCSRIQKEFAALNVSNSKPYMVDASIGVFSHKPEMALTLEQIIEIVDKNMYNIKLKGKEALY